NTNPVDINHDGALAGRGGATLAQFSVVGQCHIEEVGVAIPSDQRAARIEHGSGVVRSERVTTLFRHSAVNEVQRVPGTCLTKRRADGGYTVFKPFCYLGSTCLWTEEREVLRQHDQARSPFGCSRHPVPHRSQVCCHIRATLKLNHCTAESVLRHIHTSILAGHRPQSAWRQIGQLWPRTRTAFSGPRSFVRDVRGRRWAGALDRCSGWWELSRCSQPAGGQPRQQVL